MLRFFRCATLILGLVPGAWAAADPQRLVRDVHHLAAPEMKGRASGSPELEKAAEYIAGQFRAAGLDPLVGKSYLQPFTLITGATLGPGNTFEITTPEGRRALHASQDYVPFSFSSRTTATGSVVFAGYGITAPEYNYDDYAHFDVRDKIVLVLRHEPQEFDEKSVFLGRDFTRHASLVSKAINARNHGARALLVVNDRAAHPKEDDALLRFGSTQGPEDSGIPVMQIKAEIAGAWLEPLGKSLNELQSSIDKTLQPEQLVFPDTLQVAVHVDIERHLATVSNVVAFLPGQTDETIVIGAHYDHLGLGEQDSLAPSLAGQVHPGADDNASGTAGLMELARQLAAERQSLRRGVVFIAFAGEELGLLGSNYYVNHPLKPLDKTAAMINLDMIGRLRNSKLYIGGVGTGSTLKPLVEEAAKKTKFQVEYSAGGFDASDHTSFAAKQVPVLFFFSGLHGDYHKPSDTWDKIDGPSIARVVSLVQDVAERVDRASARPEFVRVAEPRPTATGGGGGGGYGPYFGSIPDFAQEDNGVKFADVRDGSPAGKAGLKAGDVLVEFDGKPIKNLYDFTYALRSKQVGDQVPVRVLRGGEALQVTVTLEQRR